MVASLPVVLGAGAGGTAAVRPVAALACAAAVVGWAGLRTARSRRAATSPPLRRRRLALPGAAHRDLAAAAPGPATRARTLAVARGVVAIALVTAVGAWLYRGWPPDGGTLGWAVTAVAAVSVVVGPLWRAVSPWRAVADGMAWLRRPRQSRLAPPERAGVFPAAGTALAGTVLVLASPPPAVAIALAVATVIVLLGGAWRYGPDWLANADAVEAASDLLARLAPVGPDRAAPNALVLRGPLLGVVQGATPPGLRALVAVWAAALATVVVTGGALPAPSGRAGAALAPTLDAVANAPPSLVLAALLGLAAAGIRAATPRRFLVGALVPALAGWTLAVGLLAGGPATAFTTRSPGVVVAGLGLVLAGHLLAVSAAHRTAVARFDLHAARAVQFPLRAALAASAALAAWLAVPA